MNLKGRVGAIVQNARIDLQELGLLTSDWAAEVWLSKINSCLDDIALSGYWQTSGLVDITAGQSEIDIIAALPFFHSLVDLQFTGVRHFWCKNAGEFQAYQRAQVPAIRIVGSVIQWTVPPTASVVGGIQIDYNRSQPQLGGGIEIILDSGTDVAVANLGGGLVGFPTTVENDLTSSDIINISGSTNYSGEFPVHADTTESQIVIAATYIAEELTSSVKCGRYYTPPTPRVNDNVYISWCCKELCKGDAQRKELYASFNAEFETAKYKLMNGQDGGLRMKPGRR